MADNRSSCWSVTINNPTPADNEEIAQARQRGWKVDGQLEKGEEGTFHLQLMVRTPQVRFSAVKKQFSRAHIEPARNAKALANYVTKEATRVGDLPSSNDRYPSLSRFWELVAQTLNNGKRTWQDNDKEAFQHVDLYNPDYHDPGRVYFYSASKDFEMHRDPLRFLDDAAEDLIGRGYFVEVHACNPASRSSFKKWWRSILFRAMETARQTDSVQIPTIPVEGEEHNQLDADDNARAQATDGLLEGQLGTDDEGDSDEEGSEVSGTSGSEGSSDNC